MTPQVVEPSVLSCQLAQDLRPASSCPTGLASIAENSGQLPAH